MIPFSYSFKILHIVPDNKIKVMFDFDDFDISHPTFMTFYYLKKWLKFVSAQ